MSEEKKGKRTSSGSGEPTVERLPVLALRNAVLFPGTLMPLVVGRPKTLALLRDIKGTERRIAILTQKDRGVDDPKPGEMFESGTVARLFKILQETEQGSHIVVQGVERFRVLRYVQTEPYLEAEVEIISDEVGADVESDALARSLREAAAEMLRLQPDVPAGMNELLEQAKSPGQLAYLVVSNLNISIEDKMTLLDAGDTRDVLRKALEVVHRRLEELKVSQKIKSEVSGDLSKAQREYVLRKQLDAIKKELSELGVEDEDGLDELKRRLEEARLPEEARKIADKELNRLRTIQPASPEYTVARTYLDWLASLPWHAETVDNLDVNNARVVLDARHYGLEKVKKRILEYIAVRKLKSDMKGPILCLVGPPGVGKTSLGQCIASALGRKFVRMALGGVRDEAEIRGHRRTYIGALPGKIIQSLKRAERKNPVFLLDEVDKLGRDWRGDPTSALLEVLDPEQNHSFVDHYLDVAFDLSKVLFVATANTTETIPAPLLDRMEVLEIPGYTRLEKLHIAREHLFPKQRSEHGLALDNPECGDDVLGMVIDRYTREAGVRNLERRLADVCRAVAVSVAEDRSVQIALDEETVRTYLGPERFEAEQAERTVVPGVATGLAWTAVGGDILFIEVSRMPGKGRLRITGQLGEVMKESCEIAVSYVRSWAAQYGINQEEFEKNDIHIHVPAGATPKDGPSAGVTIFTALVSLLSGTRVRSDTAMTGEITLRGLVLPVGGIKDKVLAAQRSGIKRVILPDRNRKDLPEIPESVRETLEIVFVRRMDEVLLQALESVEALPRFQAPVPPADDPTVFTAPGSA
jgi:ATP-dependent Lon protease